MLSATGIEVIAGGSDPLAGKEEDSVELDVTTEEQESKRTARIAWYGKCFMANFHKGLGQ
jgi:hypothetical protein